MLKGRTPTKAERRHMAELVCIGCIICREWLGVYSPAEIHHTAGKTTPGCHRKTLPLCARHHRIPGPDWVSRHGNGKAAFEAAYATESELLGMVSTSIERVERLSV